MGTSYYAGAPQLPILEHAVASAPPASSKSSLTAGPRLRSQRLECSTRSKIAPPINAPRISNPPITCKTRSYHASLFLPEIPLQNKSNAIKSPAIPWPTRWVSRGATGETVDHILPVRFFFGRFGICYRVYSVCGLLTISAPWKGADFSE